MTDILAYDMIVTLYATFGKPVPKREAPTVQVITRFVRDIPDDAIESISESIQQLDDLPKNLGKAIWAAYYSWASKNGVKVERAYCGTCQGKGGWDVIQHPDPQGIMPWRHFWARCPRCTQGPDREKLKTDKELRDMGFHVVPPNYPGGWIAYRYGKGISKPLTAEQIEQRARSMGAVMRKMNKTTGYSRDYMQADPQKAPREQGRL